MNYDPLLTHPYYFLHIALLALILASQLSRAQYNPATAELTFTISA